VSFINGYCFVLYAAYETFAEKANFPPETFEPVLDRNSLSGVNKPDPQVAHHILGEWGGVLPHEVWFVGDSIDDIRCGKGAGCNTCLITASNKKHDDEHLIDHRVTTLKEFMDILNEYEKST
jgi:phosphoglycolate phosphatase-like HAD superfamily hydrolase